MLWCRRRGATRILFFFCHSTTTTTFFRMGNLCITKHARNGRISLERHFAMVYGTCEYHERHLETWESYRKSKKKNNMGNLNGVYEYMFNVLYIVVSHNNIEISRPKPLAYCCYVSSCFYTFCAIKSSKCVVLLCIKSQKIQFIRAGVVFFRILLLLRIAKYWFYYHKSDG